MNKPLLIDLDPARCLQLISKADHCWLANDDTFSQFRPECDAIYILNFFLHGCWRLTLTSGND